MSDTEPKYTVTIEKDDEADFGWCLTATHNGECVLSATDNGAPEDNLFLRDYDWIKPALERAYALGVADGAMSARTLRDWARSRLEVERSRRLDAVEGAATHQWTDANARAQTLEAVLRELDAPDEEEP